MAYLEKLGEIAGKFSKIIRDYNCEATQEHVDQLILELGDIQWFVAILAEDLGSSLSEVMIKNIEKLQSRKQRGVIGGSGDNR